MKIFLKNTVLFIALAIGLTIALDRSLSWMIDKHATFELQSKPRHIVIGHSHPECAFNDSLIHGMKNLAESGESYYYSYHKLKKVLDQNPDIEAILIEFSNNHISRKMNDWIWDDKHLSNKFTRYSAFIPLNEQLILFGNNPKGFLNAFSYAIKSKMSTLATRNFDFSNRLGGFRHLVHSKADSILRHSDKKTSNQGTDVYTVDSVSTASLHYLEKILELVANKHKKKVFLVRSPIHPRYEEYANEPLYSSILREHFQNVEYLDFSNFPIANSEFADLGHLNYKGARIFSEWFDTLIRDGLLTREKKQEYIRERIRHKSLERKSDAVTVLTDSNVAVNH